jgi:hypothetical protein
LLLPTTQTILRTSFIWRYRQIENSLKTNWRLNKRHNGNIITTLAQGTDCSWDCQKTFGLGQKPARREWWPFQKSCNTYLHNVPQFDRVPKVIPQILGITILSGNWSYVSEMLWNSKGILYNKSKPQKCWYYWGYRSRNVNWNDDSFFALVFE